MSSKNKELGDRINQATMEAQSCHYRRQYNESVVNVLQNNRQQVIAQSVVQVKKGCGDNKVDGAASYISQNHQGIVGGSGNPVSIKKQLNCSAYKGNRLVIAMLALVRLPLSSAKIQENFCLPQIVNMITGLINANPVVYEKKERRLRTAPDPEHPYSLEELKVITEDAIEVDDKNSYLRITFTPTVEHCSMATVIGLCLRVKLMRSLPSRYKVTETIL
ncbi:hypothetical protein F0562_011873 [Nyssa sinensis]|uniref:Uncharacterized protein n=1 Tax=Nyssa sinensis TaxID=561372 RepID=A0A5J4ZUW9_9ASTE|nr:hypothetical protein F0562_011873 [Nyssa sinensis]